MPTITLLSDFGLGDASVAIAKGALLRHVPDAQFVDISHLVEMFHHQQASYLLRASWRAFPAGTVHLMLFDVFSEPRPSVILCECEGHYFLAPDNGLLPLVFFPFQPVTWTCFQLRKKDPMLSWLEAAGDVIRSLAVTPPAESAFGLCVPRPAPDQWMPHYDDNVIECHIIHIDRFENVVVNVTRQQFEDWSEGRRFRIQFARDEVLTSISTHYYDVEVGKKLCRFNGTGYLEIAINRGPAASLFGFKLLREKHVFYNSIKIHFE